MADVASSLKSWSTTLSSNNPTSASTIGSGLAPNFQQIQATLRNELATRSSAVTAAATTDIGAKDEGTVLVSNSTGTIAITSLGTVSIGIKKLVTFSVSGGSLSLTYNATSLILPSKQNITVNDGDSMYAESLGSGNWKVHAYYPASGAQSGNLTGAINEAKGTSVAAAATTSIWATDGNLIHVTGTGGPITSFGTAPQAAAKRTVVIDSAGVVITSGANLVCPEGVNIVTSAGDVLEIVADTTTQHRIASYVRGGSRRITGSFTRDISLASGTQVITGVGFRAKKVNFKMLVSSIAGPNMSIGDDDGTYRNCMFDIGSGNYSGSSSFSIYSFGSGGANLYQGLISAFSNDGFTITWTKTGSPTGTITIFYDARM